MRVRSRSASGEGMAGSGICGGSISSSSSSVGAGVESQRALQLRFPYEVRLLGEYQISRSMLSEKASRPVAGGLGIRCRHRAGRTLSNVARSARGWDEQRAAKCLSLSSRRPCGGHAMLHRRGTGDLDPSQHTGALRPLTLPPSPAAAEARRTRTRLKRRATTPVVGAPKTNQWVGWKQADSSPPARAVGLVDAGVVSALCSS